MPTVKELIDKLKEYPDNFRISMPEFTVHDPFVIAHQLDHVGNSKKIIYLTQIKAPSRIWQTLTLRSMIQRYSDDADLTFKEYPNELYILRKANPKYNYITTTIRNIKYLECQIDPTTRELLNVKKISILPPSMRATLEENMYPHFIKVE